MALLNKSNGLTPAQLAAQGSKGGKEDWKSDAFLNVYVTTKAGKQVKVGAIPLRKSVAIQAALIERLQIEGGVEALKDHVTFSFNLAQDEVPELDF